MLFYGDVASAQSDPRHRPNYFDLDAQYGRFALILTGGGFALPHGVCTVAEEICDLACDVTLVSKLN